MPRRPCDKLTPVGPKIEPGRLRWKQSGHPVPGPVEPKVGFLEILAEPTSPRLDLVEGFSCLVLGDSRILERNLGGYDRLALRDQGFEVGLAIDCGAEPLEVLDSAAFHRVEPFTVRHRLGVSVPCRQVGLFGSLEQIDGGIEIGGGLSSREHLNRVATDRTLVPGVQATGDLVGRVGMAQIG